MKEALGCAAAVGGGFNGKSTLLQAIEAGVYDKVRPGFRAKQENICLILHRPSPLSQKCLQHFLTC